MEQTLAEKVIPIRNWIGDVEKELRDRGSAPKLPLNMLPLFNNKVWGLRPKTLLTIGSRTSQGKTALSLQVAFDLADSGHSVLYLSLEDDVEFLIERLFCNVMRVNNADLMRGAINTDIEIQTKWKTFSDMVQKLPLLITCGVGKTFNEINRLIELLSKKPEVVILDYIQNVARRNNESREMINEYIRHYREIGIKNNIAMVLCSQVNRQALDAKNSEPTLGMLKETGVLEEASDQVWLLHWEYMYTYDQLKREEFKIIVAKNKRGRCGSHTLKFIPENFRFEDNILSGTVDKDNVTEDAKVALEKFGGILV